MYWGSSCTTRWAVIFPKKCTVLEFSNMVNQLLKLTGCSGKRRSSALDQYTGIILCIKVTFRSAFAGMSWIMETFVIFLATPVSRLGPMHAQQAGSYPVCRSCMASNRKGWKAVKVKAELVTSIVPPPGLPLKEKTLMSS